MNDRSFLNLIQINAEAIGIKNLDNEVLEFINIELEEKMKMILLQSKKFMRVSKRKTLKVDDLVQSIKFYNFKPIYGYDPYSNAEYEQTESVKGLWRPKQYIIDIEDFLSKPIASCPMEIFPHFHWISIEGKRPLIPENFIREEAKANTDKEKITKTVDLNEIKNQTTISLYNNLNNNSSNQEYSDLRPVENKPKKSNQVEIVGSVIHNISKELQIFFENFQERFRKEIKKTLIANSNVSITKEFDISLSVIEREPGIVELLPYIIEFIMSYLGNKQYLQDINISQKILKTIMSIIKNPYFYLEPYIHQIINILLSIILIDSCQENLKGQIELKDLSIEMLTSLIKKYEIKYSKFISHLINLLDKFIIPVAEQSDKIGDNNQDSKRKWLTSYGAVKCLTALGPSFIISHIIPKQIDILNCFNFKTKKNTSPGELLEGVLKPNTEEFYLYSILKESAILVVDFFNELNLNTGEFISKSENKKNKEILEILTKNFGNNILNCRKQVDEENTDDININI